MFQLRHTLGSLGSSFLAGGDAGGAALSFLLSCLQPCALIASFLSRGAQLLQRFHWVWAQVGRRNFGGVLIRRCAIGCCGESVGFLVQVF